MSFSLLYFLYKITVVDMDVEDKPKILILGGTNFMGKTLIKWFNENASSYEIYAINRGKVYW